MFMMTIKQVIPFAIKLCFIKKIKWKKICGDSPGGKRTKRTLGACWCDQKNPGCDVDNFPGGEQTRGNLIRKNLTSGIHQGKMTKKNSSCITVTQMKYFAIEFFFSILGGKFFVNQKVTCALFILFTLYNGYNYEHVHIVHT